MNEYKCWMCEKTLPETQMTMYDLCLTCQHELDRIIDAQYDTEAKCPECAGDGSGCLMCEGTGKVQVQL